MSEFDERIVTMVTGCFANYDFFDALDRAYALGFRSVGLMPAVEARHSLGKLPTLDFRGADDAQRRRIKKAMSRFAHISIHQAWNDEWQEWFDCAEFLGAEIVTVHAGEPQSDEAPEQFLERRSKLLSQIGDYAGTKKIKVGVENVRGRYMDYVQLIREVDHPFVGATVDVGHCAYFDEVRSATDAGERADRVNEVLLQLVRDLGPKLYHLHVHNLRPYEAVDFSNIPHPYWHPGMLVDHRDVPSGVIDFPALFGVLKEIGYGGLYEIELEEPDKEAKLVHSAEYLNSLLR